MADTLDVKEWYRFYKSEDEFKQLEHAMETSLQQHGSATNSPKNEQPHSSKKIDLLFEIGQNAYDCNELTSLSEIYSSLQELGLDHVPIVKARLALGEAFSPVGSPSRALLLATESFQNNPEEVDAYFALAKVMSTATSPFQARQWFDLYKKGKGIHNVPAGHLDFEMTINHQTRSFHRVEDSILKVLTTPEALENVLDLPTIRAVFNSGDTPDCVKRIQDQPCVDTLRSEFDKSPNFKYFAIRLGQVCADLGLYPFQILNEIELSRSLSEVGGQFSKWTQKLVTHLCRFLGCGTIIDMQQTCRPLRQMFDHESIWYGQSVKLRVELSLPLRVSPGLSNMILQFMRLTTTKAVFKAMRFCFIFHSLCIALFRKNDVEPTTESISIFHSVIERYNYGFLGAQDPFELFLVRIVDLAAADENSGPFCSDFTNLMKTLATFAVTNRGIMVALLDYYSIMSMRRSDDPSIWIPFAKASIDFFHSSCVQSASAVVGALESAVWMTKFRVQCLTPSTCTTSAVCLRVHLAGLYHTHFHYELAKLHGCHETGILELSREDGKYKGKGVDTIGSFHFDAIEISFFEKFCWIQSYEDGTCLRFWGICLPSGFGGVVTDLDSFVSIAYWFMCRDRSAPSAALYETFVEGVIQDREMKKTWAITNPLQIAHGERSKLDLTRDVLLTLETKLKLVKAPSTSLLDILAWSQTMISVPDLGRDSNHSLRKGRFEPDTKYAMRQALCFRLATYASKNRSEMYQKCSVRLAEAYMILRNPEHPKYESTLSWYAHIFCIHSPSNFECAMQELDLFMSSLRSRNKDDRQKLKMNDVGALFISNQATHPY